MKPWQRNLWAVRFWTARSIDKPMLLGEAWNKPRPESYAGEPSRVLTFMTRKHARAWCRDALARYDHRTDSCADWRFTPVRVRETVEPVNGKGTP